MSDVEELKTKIKKLSSRAVTQKMNLHDLAEDLPIDWTNIMSVAQQAYDAYEALEAARKELKEQEALAS
ncbi:CCE_0567 family metalloprotein [Methyloceanibacter sp. wino2]|uniref:CCE_0567 family metalloprotein n=1 Tax=Methyloceanibacter sp. wino2 TaxID=2170729 RepID=UPI000D3E9EE6|nr:CCE_0567 family metalloprotein [Methyloceanibacter sp. wino2]